jgi:hypothetical protein
LAAAITSLSQVWSVGASVDREVLKVPGLLDATDKRRRMDEEPPYAGITKDSLCPASAKSHQPRDLGIKLVEENRFLAARDGWPRKTARASLPKFERAICNRSPPGSPARIARNLPFGPHPARYHPARLSVSGRRKDHQL